jgi:hypothetical protein
MSEEAATKSAQKRKVGRSPAYPNLSVQKALEKAKALYDQEGDYAAPLSSVTTAWNYSSKSSGARQTLATLKYYGLIDVTGDGDTRKVKVSDIARRILLDQREDQAEKKQLIRKVALSPAAHKTLYDHYASGLASDGSVVHFLVFDEGFNQAAAAELLAEFKETARYIGLYEPSREVDKSVGGIHSSGLEPSPPAAKIGDRIQWTNQGVDQFPQGATVLGFSDDGQWTFTDRGSSGVPTCETSIMEAPAQTPPSMPAHLVALVNKQKREPEDVKTGLRKAVFPVEEGDVTLIFPENISADGLEELGQYLNIFLKKEQKKRADD